MNKTIKMVGVGFLSLIILAGCGTNDEGKATDVPKQKVQSEQNTGQNLESKQEATLAMNFVDIFYNGTKASDRDYFINRHFDHDTAEILKMGDISDTNNVSDLQLVDSADFEMEGGLGHGTIVKMQAQNVKGEPIQIVVYTLNNKILKFYRSDTGQGGRNIEEVNRVYFNR